MYFVLLGELNPPEKAFTLQGRLFNPPKGKHVLKRAESHCCEVNTLGILACNFRTFLRFIKRTLFRKSLLKSEQSDRSQPEKL